MHDWRDFIFWWLLSMIGAATVVGAKLGMILWGMAPDMPADPAMADHWTRRRRWLTYTELSALPAFATVAVAIAAQRGADPIVAVLIAMALGGIGFTLLLDALQWLFRIRVGLPTAPAPPEGGKDG